MEWVPLIGDANAAVVLGRIAFIGLAALFIGMLVFGYGENNSDYRYETAGVVIIAPSIVLVAVATLFAALAALSNAMREESPFVPASKVRVDYRDTLSVALRCPEVSLSGRLQFLGREDDRGFRAKAYRFRTDGRLSDLRRDAGFVLYRERVSPDPLAVVTDIRADGRWQSGYLPKPALLAPSKEYPLAANLGEGEIQTEDGVTYSGKVCDNLRVLPGTTERKKNVR